MSLGVFGPGYPPATDEERRGLRRIVWRRRLVWVLVGGTIPVFLFGPEGRWAMGAWFILLALAVGWHNLGRCPRCGERFNVGTLWGLRPGIPFAPLSLATQECVHCGFRLTAPQV
jgi:hypothetical protein